MFIIHNKDKSATAEDNKKKLGVVLMSE